LIAGCCDECKTPVEPRDPLPGSWECVRYITNSVPQPGNIGQLMTFYSNGTGGVGTPDNLMMQPFTWVSAEEKVYLEVEEMGIATGFNYTISGDTLYMDASASFFGGSLMEIEADYIRWYE
ncbi:MAG: hypothetical protein KOO63_16835, partial [Bacteroidales bacterium]|nr:hypothetical protein [Candidatus Latescibacterota bacterium]